MTRKATNWILEMVNEGLIDSEVLAANLLGYMSESEVQDFAESEYDYDPDE